MGEKPKQNATTKQSPREGRGAASAKGAQKNGAEAVRQDTKSIDSVRTRGDRSEAV